MEFFINTASLSCTMQNGSYLTCSAPVTSYGFNPIQLNKGSNWLSPSDAVTAVSVKTEIKNDGLKACVLDIPMYELSPFEEKQTWEMR